MRSLSLTSRQMENGQPIINNYDIIWKGLADSGWRNWKHVKRMSHLRHIALFKFFRISHAKKEHFPISYQIFDSIFEILAKNWTRKHLSTNKLWQKPMFRPTLLNSVASISQPSAKRTWHAFDTQTDLSLSMAVSLGRCMEIVSLWSQLQPRTSSRRVAISCERPFNFAPPKPATGSGSKILMRFFRFSGGAAAASSLGCWKRKMSRWYSGTNEMEQL